MNSFSPSLCHGRMGNDQISHVRNFRPPRAGRIRFKPVPWESFDLEIGAGTGTFAVDYCRSHPQRKLVALERTSEKFAKFKKKLEAQEPLGNLWALQADAQWWLPQLIHAPRIESVFLLYPNPYPKRSQAHLRFHRAPFMHKLLEVLRPGGRLLMATNLPFYFEEAREYYSSYWGLDVEETDLSHRPPRTAFEKKYVERGEICFQLVGKKPHNWTGPNLTLV